MNTLTAPYITIRLSISRNIHARMSTNDIHYKEKGPFSSRAKCQAKCNFFEKWTSCSVSKILLSTHAQLMVFHVILLRIRNIPAFREYPRRNPLVFSLCSRAHGWCGAGE